MLTTRTREFLNGFNPPPYPKRLTACYDILECFRHSARGETLLVRAKADGRLYVARIGEGARVPAGLMSLQREGLPAMIESFTEDGQTVLIRSYAPGITAKAELANGPMPKKRALDIGIKLCDALSCLHALKPPVIHRDVKPGNIILDGDKVCLIDFDIARNYSEEAAEDTVCFGTRDYAPPEQYGYAQTDARTDVYALGATLYTLLTNRTDPAKAAHTVKDAGLRRIIRRCTAFAPEDRYKTARRVKRALLSVRFRARRAAAALACLLLATAGVLTAAFGAEGGAASLLPNSAHFADPLVKRAVCVALGKAEDARVKKDELAGVKALYIWQDAAETDEQGVEELKNDWYESERSMGSLKTLEDLKLLPNLKELFIGCEPAIDLSPIGTLSGLETLHLQFMELDDISVIAVLNALKELDLAGSTVRDLSPVHECRSLTRLALHDVACTDYSFLQGLDGFAYVGMYKADSTAFLQYFRGKSTNHLNIGGSPFTRMDWLIEVKGVTVLELADAGLSDITGIDALLHLTRLVVSGNPDLEDLSPLLNIRTLETVTVSHDMQAAVDALNGQAQFSIQYSD